MTSPSRTMTPRAQIDAAWLKRTDLLDRIAARLAASPCTLGRLTHDLSLPTSAVQLLLMDGYRRGQFTRLNNNSSRYCLAQEARAA